MESKKSLSIGMCAWNEADRLPATLESLAQQDCFRDAGQRVEDIEVIVVANACTDRTETVAKQALDALQLSSSRNVAVRVVSTPVKGKANAWNLFVHECSSRGADYLILMDCDIRFLNRNVISMLVSTLDGNQTASIVRPICVKSTELEDRRSMADAIAMWMTKSKRRQQQYVSLPGAIYCARASALRSVWQPLGMIGEDGHVRDMIVTENWRCPKARKDEKVVLAGDVSIAFESHSGLRDILKHQVRARIGLANRAIFHRFLDEVVGAEDAAQLTKRLNSADPDWYGKMIYSGLRRGSWWLMPWPLFGMQRTRASVRRSVFSMLKSFPAALVGDLSDIIADLRANQHYKRGSALGIWR